MTLYNIYRCSVCGFMNSLHEDFVRHPITRLRLCPKCGAEGTDELMQGPAFDDKPSRNSNEESDNE